MIPGTLLQSNKTSLRIRRTRHLTPDSRCETLEKTTRPVKLIIMFLNGVKTKIWWSPFSRLNQWRLLLLATEHLLPIHWRFTQVPIRLVFDFATVFAPAHVISGKLRFVKCLREAPFWNVFGALFSPPLFGGVRFCQNGLEHFFHVSLFDRGEKSANRDIFGQG